MVGRGVGLCMMKWGVAYKVIPYARRVRQELVVVRMKEMRRRGITNSSEIWLCLSSVPCCPVLQMLVTNWGIRLEGGSKCVQTGFILIRFPESGPEPLPPRQLWSHVRGRCVPMLQHDTNEFESPFQVEPENSEHFFTLSNEIKLGLIWNMDQVGKRSKRLLISGRALDVLF